jgi:hypothetical protein
MEWAQCEDCGRWWDGPTREADLVAHRERWRDICYEY